MAFFSMLLRRPRLVPLLPPTRRFGNRLLVWTSGAGVSRRHYLAALRNVPGGRALTAQKWRRGGAAMNSIIYLVGAVVIVAAILSFLGFR